MKASLKAEASRKKKLVDIGWCLKYRVEKGVGNAVAIEAWEQRGVGEEIVPFQEDADTVVPPYEEQKLEHAGWLGDVHDWARLRYGPARYFPKEVMTGLRIDHLVPLSAGLDKEIEPILEARVRERPSTHPLYLSHYAEKDPMPLLCTEEHHGLLDRIRYERERREVINDFRDRQLRHQLSVEERIAYLETGVLEAQIEPPPEEHIEKQLRRKWIHEEVKRAPYCAIEIMGHADDILAVHPLIMELLKSRNVYVRADCNSMTPHLSKIPLDFYGPKTLGTTIYDAQGQIMSVDPTKVDCSYGKLLEPIRHLNGRRGAAFYRFTNFTGDHILRDSDYVFDPQGCNESFPKDVAILVRPVITLPGMRGLYWLFGHCAEEMLKEHHGEDFIVARFLPSVRAQTDMEDLKAQKPKLRYVPERRTPVTRTGNFDPLAYRLADNRKRAD